MKKIHSFYLDIKTLKNLRREIPIILSDPLDSFFSDMNMSVIGNNSMLLSIKSSEISTIHMTTVKEKENWGSTASEGGFNWKERQKCCIY